jgi:hypothetical protein
MAFPVIDRASVSTRAALARERLEGLLRGRQLDRTLTTALTGSVGAERVAPFGLAALDARLPGGLPRGHVSEIVGPVSSGRTSLVCAWLGAASRRGESVALIDTFDRFDPSTAADCGVDLRRLLWVRGQAITRTSGAVDPAWLPGVRTVDGPGTLLERTIDRALKALNLVLQSNVCTAVVLDFADVPANGIRRVPPTTWMRLQRIIEGSETACLLLASMPLARSAGGVTIATGNTPVAAGAGVSSAGVVAAQGAHARWAGSHDRSRRLAGLDVAMRLSSPRQSVQGSVALHGIAINRAWTID